jgi:hypothetical protein
MSASEPSTLLAGAAVKRGGAYDERRLEMPAACESLLGGLR